MTVDFLLQPQRFAKVKPPLQNILQRVDLSQSDGSLSAFNSSPWTRLTPAMNYSKLTWLTLANFPPISRDFSRPLPESTNYTPRYGPLRRNYVAHRWLIASFQGGTNGGQCSSNSKRRVIRRSVPTHKHPMWRFDRLLLELLATSICAPLIRVYPP